MTAGDRDRPTRRVEHCMGTVFSIDVRDPGEWVEAIDDVVEWLHHVDRTFSTYRADSDISRLRRGELTLDEADPAVAEVLDLCVILQRQTGGYFTATWSGALDPTGLVKGWAIERASGLLRQAGSTNHAVNGGGDIQVAGESAPGQPWRIGISDPADPQRLLTALAVRDQAVATSGRAERGDHILDPFSGRPATALAGVTVVGPSLAYADAYATAAVAMGADATHWLDTLPGYEALVVGSHGAVTRCGVSEERRRRAS